MKNIIAISVAILGAALMTLVVALLVGILITGTFTEVQRQVLGAALLVGIFALVIANWMWEYDKL